MKSRSNKGVIALLFVIPFLLIIAIFIPYLAKNLIPDYSVDNVTRKGCSIFFEALEQIEEARVESEMPIETYNYDTVQVVMPHTNFNINRNGVKDWIKAGGQLVYLQKYDIDEIGYASLEYEDDVVKRYSYGEGKIITCNVNHIINSQLISDRDAAYTLLKQIHTLDYQAIIFNEYYLFVLPEKEGLWDVIPFGIKLILYQMMIIIAAFFYYKGKRFGKTVPLYEEEERSKNEYLYAAANLYRHEKCWDLAIDSYYDYLLHQAFRLDFVNKDLYDYWQKLELPEIEKVSQVIEFMKVKNQKHSERKYIHIITIIEELVEIIDTRSELYWK